MQRMCYLCFIDVEAASPSKCFDNSLIQKAEVLTFYSVEYYESTQLISFLMACFGGRSNSVGRARDSW